MAKVLLRSLSLLLLTLGLLGAAAAEDPDPPARVGGASLVEGDVAYLRDGDWHPLPLNWPITTGTRLSAAPGARAEVRIGSTAIRLDGATELEFARLDDDAIVLRLLHGTIDVRVRSAEVARELSVETPEARALPLEPGRFRIDAGLTADTTAVSADAGSARVEAGDNAVVVRAGKRAEVWRGGDFRLTDARADAFDEWALARDRRYDASRSARYVSPETTGYESLDEHGDWREVPQYGPVWIPRAVPVGWAPYRTGRWAWVAPWGWTWIDEAPWGFAPFHYGRWAFVGGLWCWVPGRVVARPVYAPALVGWVGGPGWSVSVSIGTVPAVGWFPLAPREVYVPAHRHSPAYVRNVNVTHVTNVTHIHNITNVNYANRRIERAVTVVPAATVTRGDSVGRSQVHVRRSELDRHAPASPTPPVAAIAPPRPAPPRTDDRGPQRRGGPDPRREESPRAERRAGPAALPAPTAPATRVAPPQPVEVRPEPRTERLQETQRFEPSRAVAPAASAHSNGQARAEPRAIETRPASRPEPRGESRHEAQRVERPQAVAPPAQTSTRSEPREAARRETPQRIEARRIVTPAVPLAGAAAPSGPRAIDVRSEPRPQQAQPRFEPRQHMPRVESPRAAAPTPPAPMPAPTPPRVESRPPGPQPALRTTPSGPPPAAVQSQSHTRPSTPRGENPGEQGREQRRAEGRGPG
jgi:hypothetical protein